MQINYKKVRYKNLLATGNNWIEIDLASYPTTLISGNNGSGKSTFMDAIYFSLFNKGYRGVTKNDLVNEINGKLLTEIEFTIGINDYLVRRGAEPNIFEIFKNGTQLHQDSEAKEQQDYLENVILRMTPKTFRTIVCIGDANHVPFMQMTKDERRVFVEEMFGIEVFSEMHSILKPRITKNDDDLEDVEKSILDTNNYIKFIKDKNDEYKKINEEEIQKKKIVAKQLAKETKEIKNQIEIKTKELDDLEKRYKEKYKLDEEIISLNFSLSEEEKQIVSIEQDIDFYKDNCSCPTCRQEIQQKFKDAWIREQQNNIETIKKSSEIIKDKIESATKKLKEFDSVATEISETNEQLLELKTNHKINMNRIKDRTDEISKLQNELENIDSSDKELPKKLKELEQLDNKKLKLKKDSDLYDTVSLILKDGGIKSVIIKQHIPVLNKLINKYLEQMEFFCTFEMDENFKVRIKHLKRDDFGYESFSQGEKTRINLAIIFSWREICQLRNSNSTNLLILDEIMDSSLDASGMEEFLKIVVDLAKKNNIFIISHKDNISDKFSKNIRFIKEKNFSKILEG